MSTNKDIEPKSGYLWWVIGIAIISICLIIFLLAFLIANMQRSRILDINSTSNVSENPTPQLANPIIHIWKVGSPYEGNTPDNIIPPDLQKAAMNLGYQLVMRTFPATGFDQIFFDAVKTNTEPDILAFDDYGIIEGSTTNLDAFKDKGIGTDSKVLDTLVWVNGSFEALEPNSNGYEVLISTSPNFGGAKEFAISYGNDCDSKFIGSLNDLEPSLVNEIKRIATDTTFAYYRGDNKTLNDLSGGQYAKDSLAVPGANTSIINNSICSSWGNGRIAFLESLVTFDATDSLGHNKLLIVLSNSGSSWKLLLISQYTGIIQELYQQISLLSAEQGGGFISKPNLLEPPDQANLPRFDNFSVPVNSNFLKWTSTGSTTAVYLIEEQFDWGNNEWTGSYFILVQPSSVSGEAETIQIPFGVGAQPHRWRVWAIDKAGDSAISEWRIINFTN